jgi:hypothetical protein
MKIVERAINDERLDISLLLFQEQSTDRYTQFVALHLDEAMAHSLEERTDDTSSKKRSFVNSDGFYRIAPSFLSPKQSRPRVIRATW